MSNQLYRPIPSLLFMFLFWALAASSALAQITLNNIPTWTGNTRFATNVVSQVKHPSLSFNGFDCGSSCSKGYGLKQILEEVPGLSSTSPIRNVYDRLVDFHDNSLVNNPSSRGQVDANIRIMQARAFVALATYILEQNNESISGLPPHATATSLLKSALLTETAWEVDDTLQEGDDGVKWAGPLAGLARTLDLYLALENAYCFYGAQGDASAQNECTGTTSTYLLSQSEKEDIFSLHYANSIQSVNYLGGTGWTSVPGVNGFDAQPGNHPLKVQTAVGTASLIINDMTAQTSQTWRDYVQRAMSASLRPAGTERHRYFNYQTDDGKRFFAEGPYYFEYALEEVLPFWHTIRINNMLGYHPSFTASDPFNTAMFTDPLEWLADIATPEGFTPPLDDGNKQPIDVSTILRWTSAYGNGTVGQKFASIGDQRGFGADPNFLVVELAIPRLGTGQGSSPLDLVGNTTSGQTGENGEQQLIVRRGTTGSACDDVRNPGDCHYVLLNAESGDAYGRGEGHEQPDQAQLLYYIDNVSFIMDSGYDKGHGLNNSTWNRYEHHNVMQGISSTAGGLGSPYATVAGRKAIEVVNPDYLYRTPHGSIDALHVAQYLPRAVTNDLGQEAPAEYTRDVLVIDGATPYLIDFNRARYDLNYSQNQADDRELKMSYHVNSNSVQLNNFTTDGGQFISWSNVGGDGKNLYLYPVSIEYPVRVSGSDITKTSDTVQESGEENIQRVDIKDFKLIGGVYRRHFSVASIIQARNNSPTYGPKLLWESYSSDDYQGWIWQQDANTFDIFVGRSAGQHTPQALTFNPVNADPSFPSIWLELPASDDYGFVRITKQGSTGTIDDQYQVYLVEGQAPPLEASASGPDCINEGDNGSFSASASGGTPPYTFTWEFSRICFTRDVGCGTWNYAGNGPYVTFGSGRNDDFNMRVTVTDAASNTDTYGNLYVEIRPFSEGFCDSPSAKKQEAASTESMSTETASFSTVPEHYQLIGNYPNPFNPSTEIRFVLPEAAQVSLVVYDVMGREVAQLVDQRMGVGEHSAMWNASSLPSGTYLYRLTAGDFTQTKSMILMK